MFINGDIKIKHMNSQKVISFLLIIIYSVNTLIAVTYLLLVIIHDILKDSTILLWLIHDHGLSNNLFLLLLGMYHPVILLQSFPLYRFQNHIFNILIRPPSIAVFFVSLSKFIPSWYKPCISSLATWILSYIIFLIHHIVCARFLNLL